MAGTYVGTATGAFGGAPNGATKRVRGVPEWVAGRMWAPPSGPSVDLPGDTNCVRGVPKWVLGTHEGTAMRAFGG
eukprot:7016814-Pyramimonas_sp.AAC.1